MKYLYDSGSNYRFVLTYDCSKINMECIGDYLCDVTSNSTEKDLEKSDGTFMCSSQVYYKVSYRDMINTKNQYTIGNVA